uniref:Fatty acid desaturase domain-containing protein n=1 Tax=Phlebotomus papatasi TaxID=29031 RepID=A0A1B0CZP5_PHLPP
MLTLSVSILTNIYNIFLGVIGGIGITMGAHRLFTHRSFKAKPPLRRILMILFVLNGQNPLWEWARDHRQHHKYSDTDADPHNASRGFFFSHVGWLMSKKHPKVIELGKGIDMSDIEADSWIMFQKKTVIVLNCTWCVNSVTHMYGTRPYDKTVLAVQNYYVSAFSFGEGYHNYHHAFPWDYRTSEFGPQNGIVQTLIEYCAKKGWAYDLRSPTEESPQKNRVERTGDNFHHKYGDPDNFYGYETWKNLWKSPANPSYSSKPQS